MTLFKMFLQSQLRQNHKNGDSVMFFQFFLILFSLTFLNSVSYAQNIDFDKEEYFHLEAPLQGKIKKSGADKLKEYVIKFAGSDLLLKTLLAVPQEKRQYVFPFIHTEMMISHKVKSHPEIIIWKNKKPTVIAPHLKNFAQKHLEHLHPRFYSFLDPDFWSKEPSKDTPLYATFSQNPFPLPPSRDISYKYPTLQEMFSLDDNLSSELKKTTLTHQTSVGFSEIYKAIPFYQPKTISTQKFKDFLSENVSKNPSTLQIAAPFQLFVNAIKMSSEKDNFQSFIQKYGFKDLDDFALKSDLIIRAYRTLNLDLLLAIQLNSVRAETPIEDVNNLSNLQMISLMYDAQVGDVYHTAKYTDEIAEALKTNLIEYGIFIYID